METAPRIYLDNNATTLVDPRVREVIIHSLQQYMGNPSSIHYFGQESSHQLAEARRTIAAFLSVRPSEIIFTSGGTEGLNLLIRGIAGRHPGGHIVSSDLEHSGVYETVKNLVQKGHEATFISPGAFGAATV
ncbi:MAG: aminotransferase class V-fold PLP-dependent enzyme, partial [Chlamydiia bacterium]|nr:aminotransferase class V-fold PLP-dependent enzyme [Chlamydiia bacterium]